MFGCGKREKSPLNGRPVRDQVEGSTDKHLQFILDYILQNANPDERPYLQVSIFDKKILGLLDTGATRTVLGRKGWSLLSGLGICLNKCDPIVVKVANGSSCHSIGTCQVPVTLRGRTKLIRMVVLPDVPHTLILGVDFFKVMGIVPDLRNGEWSFSDEVSAVDTVNQLQSRDILTSLEQVKLQAVLEKYRCAMGDTLGCTDKAEHVIRTNSPPIKQRYYPVNPVMQKQIDQELDEMLKNDIVEPSDSGWASPILLVKKKDGNYRFCVDYRKLNSVTMPDSYPLPYISNVLDKLRNAHYLSSLDIKSAYWQVPVAEESRRYTAFTVPNRGLFQFKRMPFGLRNSPATWQRLIDNVLGSDLEPFVFVYLDDIVIVTPTFDKHLAVLEEVLRRLSEAHLTVSWDKCQFCRSELRYLGYVVDVHGLHADPEKVQAMLQLPSPKTVSEVRRILGIFSWYRRFLPNFAERVAPITELIKKSSKFEWSKECESAFLEIKELLVSAPVLQCPDYDLPFQVQTDASAFGIGAVLVQPHPDGERVISYLSRSLTKQERNFSTTERECLAVLWAIEKLRPYLEGVHFTVITDHHSLVWLQKLRDPSGRLARWAVRLQQYDFEIVHRKGKDHVVPDTLSRSVVPIDAVNEIVTPPVQDKWYLRMLKKIREKPLKYPAWRVQNDKLFKYVKQTTRSRFSDADHWKIVVPKEQRKQVMIEAHDIPTSGHLGIYKTYHRIVEKYYWPKLKNDVTHYVNHCSVCATHKVERKKPIGLMVPQPLPSKPWEIIATDLIGPFPRSTRGYQYVLVVTDCFSKFSLTFPLRKATAQAVSKHIEEDVFLLFGVPKLLLCDNGPQYKSTIFKTLADAYSVKLRYNAYYHPQANPTERVNQTLKTMIASYVSENHRHWDQNLAKVSCAMRTAKHEVIKFTPFFVNFGRHMILKGTDHEDTISTPRSEEEDQSMRQEILKDVRRRLQNASRIGQQQYNLRRRSDQFYVNQLVWRKNYVQSDAARFFSQKLAPKYIGPFMIKKKISPWTYELADRQGNLKGTWHAKDLKPASNDEVTE